MDDLNLAELLQRVRKNPAGYKLWALNSTVLPRYHDFLVAFSKQEGRVRLPRDGQMDIKCKAVYFYSHLTLLHSLILPALAAIVGCLHNCFLIFCVLLIILCFIFYILLSLLIEIPKSVIFLAFS